MEELYLSEVASIDALQSFRVIRDIYCMTFTSMAFKIEYKPKQARNGLCLGIVDVRSSS
jgi:hypothetical protein